MKRLDKQNLKPLAVIIGSSLLGLTMPTTTHAEPLMNTDPATEATYEREGFQPDGTGVSKLSYTASRTINPLYNTYQQPELSNIKTLRFTAYVDNQAINDPRDLAENSAMNELYGYGYDFAKLRSIFEQTNFTHFEEVVYQGQAICGDPDIEIRRDYYHGKSMDVASDFATFCYLSGLEDGSIAPFDIYTDLVKAKNTGQDNAYNHINESNWLDYYYEGESAGLLAGFKELQQQNPNQKLGFAVGGPGRDSFFDNVIASETMTTHFVSSVVETFQRFPMFSSVHLLWPSYQSCKAKESCSQTEQKSQYAAFISQLNSALTESFGSENPKTITVLIDNPSAFFAQENLTNVNTLLSNNVNFRVDLNQAFFEDANTLGHDVSVKEVETLLANLKSLGISEERVSIDLGNNSSSVSGIDLESGTFDESAEKLGTFANGLIDNFDVYYNYLNVDESQKPAGKNDFTSYTDPVKGAAFLYSQVADSYISHLTPVVAKQIGAVMAKNGYTGIAFNGGGMDNPLVYNALREGAGDVANIQTFNMEQQYQCESVNVSHETGNSIVTGDEANAVCQGVFNNNFANYNSIGNVQGSDFGPAKVGDYLQLEIKKDGETLALSQHLVTSSGQISGGHRYATYATGAMNNVLANLDKFSRFKVGERNSQGAINSISSTYRNNLFCSYDCDGVTLTESVVSSSYTQIGQLKGYDVVPGSLIRLDVLNSDGSVYASTTYTPNEHMSVGFRWPDELCKVTDSDSDNILKCGELVGLDQFNIINSSVYRNYIWSKDPTKSISITVASPAEE